VTIQYVLLQVRTDRMLPFYDGDDNPNVELLRNILVTYSFYNFDLGYCQVGAGQNLMPLCNVICQLYAIWNFIPFFTALRFILVMQKIHGW
jgi:hypothetical protein